MPHSCSPVCQDGRKHSLEFYFCLIIGASGLFGSRKFTALLDFGMGCTSFDCRLTAVLWLYLDVHLFQGES